ncbi:hypothetical protein Vi05172_g5184 [Venturia inaequalis]|nr:hypothetical protein Vi05172_g5184 [Venturia inaequalis]
MACRIDDCPAVLLVSTKTKAKAKAKAKAKNEWTCLETGTRAKGESAWNVISNVDWIPRRYSGILQVIGVDPSATPGLGTMKQLPQYFA